MNEFSRTSLLIGEEGQNQLSASTIAVFGVGALAPIVLKLWPDAA